MSGSTSDAAEELRRGPSPHSERVREAWESLPGEESQVDYPLAEVTPLQLGQVGQFGLGPFPPELVVEVTVTTPDGRRFNFSEAVEYERDEAGAVQFFEFEDIAPLFERVSETVAFRLR